MIGTHSLCRNLFVQFTAAPAACTIDRTARLMEMDTSMSTSSTGGGCETIKESSTSSNSSLLEDLQAPQASDLGCKRAMHTINRHCAV